MMYCAMSPQCAKHLYLKSIVVHQATLCRPGRRTCGRPPRTKPSGLQVNNAAEDSRTLAGYLEMAKQGRPGPQTPRGARRCPAPCGYPSYAPRLQIHSFVYVAI